MNRCILCGALCFGGVCSSCLELLDSVDDGTLNKFIHADASRNKRKEQKLKEEKDDKTIYTKPR